VFPGTVLQTWPLKKFSKCGVAMIMRPLKIHSHEHLLVKKNYFRFLKFLLVIMGQNSVESFINDNRMWPSSTSSYSEILQSTTTLSAGDNDQLSIQGIQYHGTSYLELSVSSYENFRYHHHFQVTSENWTVLCCIMTRSNISSAAGDSDSNSRHTAPLINVFFWH